MEGFILFPGRRAFSFPQKNLFHRIQYGLLPDVSPQTLPLRVKIRKYRELIDGPIFADLEPTSVDLTE